MLALLAMAAAVPATVCGQPHSAVPEASRDTTVGPLAVLATGMNVGRAPDAFAGHGYKLPVTLRHGDAAVVRVGRASRAHARLVYRYRAQDRVIAEGFRGGDAAIRLRPCSTRPGSGRAGWPGGIVVDRPRCVTLVVRVPGEPAVRGRVPVGRACGR